MFFLCTAYSRRKLTAKKESRKLSDGDIKVACQTACPTDAITFGDMNDLIQWLVKNWMMKEISTL